MRKSDVKVVRIDDVDRELAARFERLCRMEGKSRNQKLKEMIRKAVDEAGGKNETL